MINTIVKGFIAFVAIVVLSLFIVWIFSIEILNLFAFAVLMILFFYVVGLLVEDFFD